MRLLLADALTFHDGLVAFVIVIILGFVAWGVNWLAPPEPFRKLLFVILGVAAFLVVLNLLLILIGHPIIRW